MYVCMYVESQFADGTLIKNIGPNKNATFIFCFHKFCQKIDHIKMFAAKSDKQRKRKRRMKARKKPMQCSLMFGLSVVGTLL